MTGAADWSGPVGDVWAAEWRRTDRSFAELEPHLEAAILAAAPQRACRVVDIGCGAGTTSLAIAAARPDCAVTGVDLSPPLLAVARARSDDADEMARCRFVLGDAPASAAELAPVDLFVSRHGVMFFADPIAAFAALAAAASSDARLVFSCFADRARNPWAVDTVSAVGGMPATPQVRGHSPLPIRRMSPPCSSPPAGGRSRRNGSTIATSPALATIRSPTPPRSSGTSARRQVRCALRPRRTAPRVLPASLNSAGATATAHWWCFRPRHGYGQRA